MDAERIARLKEEIRGRLGDLNAESGRWSPETLAAVDGGPALDHNDVRELVETLARDDAFGFLFPIANLLRWAARDNDEFARTLIVLEGKFGNDLSAGRIVEAVQSVGAAEPDTALRIARRLLGMGRLGYPHMLIGGAAAKLPGECDALTRELFDSGDAGLRAIAIKSWIAGSRAGADVLGDLERAAESDDTGVRVAATMAFIAFYSSDPRRCAESIERLAAHPECARQIAGMIYTQRVVGAKMRQALDDEASLRFLDACAELPDMLVREAVYGALRELAENRLAKVLQIALKCAERDGHTGNAGEYVLERLGEAHGVRAVEALMSAPMESANIRKCAPEMIKHTIGGAGRDGLEPVFEAIRSGPDLREIGLEALRRISDPRAGEASLLEPIENFLKSLAESERIEYGRATKGDTEQAIRCGRAIDAILHRRHPDYGLARENIVHFPELDSRFGESWISEKEQERQTHPLLHMLGRKLPLAKISAWSKLAESAKTEKERSFWTRKYRYESYDWCFLRDLDSDLAMLKTTHADAYARRLRNEDDFFNTRSEIDFVMQFLGQCDIDPEPRVGTKKLDARLRICGRHVYIEVFSPDLLAELQLFTGARTVRERISGKICDKAKEQLSKLDGKDPAILAIDLGKSEISESDVKRCVLGPITGHIVVGKDAKTEESSERDSSKSMHGLDPATDVISAVVCFKEGLRGDLRRGVDYRIIPNPHARSKLSEHEIEFMKKCLGRERA